MNANTQRTVWLNTSTSANWKRPAVGIVRVELELAHELRVLYPNHQFKTCIWKNKGFIETSDAKTDLLQEKKESKFAPQKKYYLPFIGKKQAIYQIAQGVFTLTPNLLKPLLDKFYIFTSSQLSKNNRRKFGPINHQDEKEISHPFQAGDIFISVGADWNSSYYKYFHQLKQNHIKIVTCCYDLIPILYPQYCAGDIARYSSYFLELANSSNLILCISKQTERDLLTLLKQHDKNQIKTHVFPLGDNIPKSRGIISEEVKSIITNEKFILFVSTIDLRKNHEVLYRAYHLLCQQGKKKQLPKLVFAGMLGWGGADLIKNIESDPLTQGLIFYLNHVNDAELLALYEKSDFCVYPSLYEGWGLPVGEALSLGKIVVSSNRGSLPEVGGELVVYLDPWNPKIWADEFMRLIENPDYKADLQQKVAHYSPRTWSDTAQSIYQAIHSL